MMGYIILSVLVLALDMLTKRLAVFFLEGGGSVPILQGILHFTYVENTGVAFGMLQDRRIIFITVSLAVLVVLGLYFYKTKRRDRFLKFGTALVFSGAVGNLIERVFNGYVVDFIDFRLINFPVFNVADIAVCVGAVLLLLHFLFDMSDEEKKSADPEAAAHSEDGAGAEKKA